MKGFDNSILWPFASHPVLPCLCFSPERCSPRYLSFPFSCLLHHASYLLARLFLINAQLISYKDMYELDSFGKCQNSPAAQTVDTSFPQLAAFFYLISPDASLTIRKSRSSIVRGQRSASGCRKHEAGFPPVSCLLPLAS